MNLCCTFPLALSNDTWQEEFDPAQLLKIYSFPYLSRQESAMFEYDHCLEFQLFM